MDGLAELKALSKIIQGSIDAIEAAVTAKGLQFPSSSTPFSFESEAARNLPEVMQVTAVLVAAATQLVSVARSPMLSVTVAAQQVRLDICLGISPSLSPHLAYAIRCLRYCNPRERRGSD